MGQCTKVMHNNVVAHRHPNVTPLINIILGSFACLSTIEVGFVLNVVTIAPIILYFASVDCKSPIFNQLCTLLVVLSLSAFIASTLLVYFAVSELISVGLFALLILYSPSSYRLRAAYVLFLMGTGIAAALLVALIITIPSTSTPIPLIGLAPFIVKLPMWPFFHWLPEIHCEASTSISLILAGIILKFAAFGMYRFILNLVHIQLRHILTPLLASSLFGILNVGANMGRFYDLKKVIALSSLLHMNLMLISLFALNLISALAALITSSTHSFSSSSLFIVASSVIGCAYTRAVSCLHLLHCNARLAFMACTFVNLQLPCSTAFLAELTLIASCTTIAQSIVIIVLIPVIAQYILWARILIYRLYFATSADQSSVDASSLLYTIGLPNIIGPSILLACSH